MTRTEPSATSLSYLRVAKIRVALQTIHCSQDLIGLLRTDRDLPLHTPQGFIRIVESY